MMKPLKRALSKLSILLFSILLIQPLKAQDVKAGEQVFKSTCSACHALGRKMVGPDLVGVKSRWKDGKKLIAFVQDPNKFLDKDPYVMKLQQENNNARMAVPPLSEQQVKDVLEYASSGGGVAGSTSTQTSTTGGGGYSVVPADNSLLKYLFYAIVIMLVVVLVLTRRVKRHIGREEREVEIEGPVAPGFLLRLNAILFPIFLILMFVGLWYETKEHVKFFRPESNSYIGQDIDRLFNNTLIVTAIVFFITQVLLFWFAYRYRSRAGRKAYFYPHNNTIEFVWTIIPAIVLSYLVLDGFKTWQRATNNPDNKPLTVECFARQFDWTFRYPGPDGILGKVDFRKIDPGSNPLGIDYSDPHSQDDYTTTELHLPVKRDIYLKLRSQDVIHAAYLPHFRVQMYAQPGMDNRIRFQPIWTTAEFRKKINNPNFNFELACNQLCGSAHWNMRRLITIETQNEFDTWGKGNKPAYQNYLEQTKQQASR